MGATDPATLDPNAAEDSQSISVLNGLHRGLMAFTPELGTRPELAESVSNNEDFTEFTFTLREDATYSDGTPIVAGDLVYSWKRLVTPSLAHSYGYLLCIVEGVSSFLQSCSDDASGDDADIDAMGVEAPDDRTFIVRLSSPATFFLSVTALWPVVPLKPEHTFGEAAGYVSSGPYVLSQWDHNSLIVLDPNPNWYGEQKAQAQIQLNIGGDPDAAFVNFEQGNLDMVVVPGTQVRRVLDDPTYAENYTLIRKADLGITYYNFATCIKPANACPSSDGTEDGRSPTANQNFRIALTHAIDKEQFRQLTFGGTGQIANSFVMPGLLGYQGDDFAGPYPFDVDAANAAMQLALDELGVEADPATDDCDDACQAAARVNKLGTITVGYNSDAGHLPRAVNLVEQWRTKLGFAEGQFQLTGTDFPTFLQQRQAGTYMVSRNGWGADFPHPHNQLDGLFTCGGTNNDQQWCNEEFDALLLQGAQETDQAEQDRIYREAEALMLAEAPMLPLRFGESVALVQPWVTGYVATSSDAQNPGDKYYETITVAAH